MLLSRQRPKSQRCGGQASPHWAEDGYKDVFRRGGGRVLRLRRTGSGLPGRTIHAGALLVPASPVDALHQQ